MTKHRFRALDNPDRPARTFGAVCADCGEGILHPNHDPEPPCRHCAGMPGFPCERHESPTYKPVKTIQPFGADLADAVIHLRKSIEALKRSGRDVHDAGRECPAARKLAAYGRRLLRAVEREHTDAVARERNP